MSELEIVAVDPFDDGAFDAFHAAYLESELAAEEGVTSPWQLEELRASRARVAPPSRTSTCEASARPTRPVSSSTAGRSRATT